jgi:hypothetical protein
MLALALATALSAAPPPPGGDVAKLIAIWLDRGSPYMELRPDGSGRIGAVESTWTAEEKGKIHVTQKESGDQYDLQYAFEDGGKKLRLFVQSQVVELERSKQKPAAKAPPPPKKPSELEAEKDGPDAGTPKKKPGKKGKGK